ncbi:MAG: hypothetical protein JW881_01400 [Spirochaetales bacterium]|nr:hypothetical protein [Spirochaetales bacterium]
MKKNIILFFLLFILMSDCCPIKPISIETVKEIKITVYPVKTLREKPLIFFLERYEIGSLINIINYSKCTDVKIKFGIREGEYLIEIFYIDDTVDEIFMPDPICFIWRTKKQIMKNNDLGHYVRELLFENLKKQGIRLE